MKRMRLLAVAAVLLGPAGAWAQNLPDDHEHDRDERPFPKLTISVKVTEEKSPTGAVFRLIEAEGEGQYPDGAVIVVDIRLKEDQGGFIEPKYVGRTQAGRWETKSIPLGSNVYKGPYVVRASFDPMHQPLGFVNRLNPELNPGVNFAFTEATIGTPEEIAAEAAEVQQFYARRYLEVKAKMEAVLAEYEKQKAAPDAKSWNDFATDLMNELMVTDHRIAEWKSWRMNIIMLPVYEDLSKLLAGGTTFLIPVLSQALGLADKPTPAEVEAAASQVTQVQESLARLDKALGQIVLDPQWKEPEAPKRPVIRQPPPPVRPIDPVPLPTPTQPAKPKGRQGGERFTMVEAGIALAVVCGVGILAIMLKKK